MRCGWCGSEDVDYETVDIGVGRQQVSPGICLRCGAVEIGPFDQEPINPVDKRRGWYAGPDELQFVGPVTLPVPVVRREAFRAWFCDYGTRVLVPWSRMTHGAFVERIHNGAQFRTHCGFVFDACEAPPDDFITCLVCLTEDT